MPGIASRKESSDQRKRQGKDRMLDLDHLKHSQKS
jgi:hypothetical protein